MDKRMEILNRKIKNRGRNEKIKIIFIAFLCALVVLALCIGGMLWYGKDSAAGPADSVSVEDEANASSPGREDKTEGAGKTEIEAGVDLGELKTRYIELFEERHPGAKLSFLIKDLDRGNSVVYNPVQMNSASVVKLFIMQTVFEQMAENGYELTAEKAKELEIMITQSNNNAANLFIDDFGGVDSNRKVTGDNVINTTISKAGYKHTQLNRKMHDQTPPEGPTGFENYTGVEDVCALYESIYNKSFAGEEYSRMAMEFLKKQERRNKIPSKIDVQYPDVTVANKTGELSRVDNDAAIIMGDDYNLILVILVDDIALNEDGSANYAEKSRVQATIGDMALMLVEKYEEQK